MSGCASTGRWLVGIPSLLGVYGCRLVTPSLLFGWFFLRKITTSTTAQKVEIQMKVGILNGALLVEWFGNDLGDTGNPVCHHDNWLLGQTTKD